MYLVPGVFSPRGLYLVLGVYLVLRGLHLVPQGVPGLGVYLVQGCVPGPRGVSAPGGVPGLGMYLIWGYT